MKKIAVLCSTLFLSASLIFAGDFKPELHTTPSVRQQGFGGFYTTDVDNFYSLYSNPAALGKRRAHSLFPGIDVHLGGPLQDSVKIYNSLVDGDFAVLSDVIKENHGLKMDIDIQPLLSFGHISGWGFGWGFTTQAFINASVPGIALADVQAGAEGVLTLGFGFPIINSDNFLLSVGATAKGFAQGAMSYTGSLVTLMNAFDSGASNLPLYLTTGFTFDAGVYLSLCNRLNVGVVCNNPFSMAWVSKGSFESPSFDFNQVTRLEPRLSFGVSYAMPTAWSGGAISSFKVMGDYRNVFTLIEKGRRNPWLELSCGTELVLANILSLRFGMSEMLPSAGVGLKFGTFNLDLAMYGKELGLEPGSSPCLNASLFLGFTY